MMMMMMTTVRKTLSRKEEFELAQRGGTAGEDCTAGYTLRGRGLNSLSIIHWSFWGGRGFWVAVVGGAIVYLR